MSLDNVPLPRIASGGAPPAFAYSGAPEAVGSLVTVGPPPQAAAPTGARRVRPFGLYPASAGALFPMIVREAPKVRVDPREVSLTRASLRKAKVTAHVKEAAMIAAAGTGAGITEEYKAAVLAARDANDLTAALTRKLAEFEASNAQRPIRVVLATVREPAEVADEDGRLREARYVCLHDGCKGGPGWADEASMRRAHPTDTEMKRAQQCHVFALMLDAPLDPLDPDGEMVGYVAPVGGDGTTIAHLVAKAEEVDERDVEMDDMRAKLARLEALVAEMAKGGGKK